MPIIGRNHGSYYSGERPKATVAPLQCADLPNITVTGKLVGGQVWGSNPYTVDSDWAVAAVHAGICAPGETVEISRLTPIDSSPYNGSTKNGVVTSTKTTSICGYTIKLAGTTNPCGPYADVSITGKASGVVLGSNPYADGTDIAAAAVHAGLCAVGESITVERYNPGLLAPYNGTARNGITSQTVFATNRCGFYIRKKVVAPPPTPTPPPPEPKKKIFDYVSNATQSFTVPAGVTKIKVKLWGAGGGGGKLSGAGGSGGYTYIEVPVTPGEQLTLYVPRGGFGGGTGGYGTTFSETAVTPYESGVDFSSVGGMPGWPYRVVTGGINSQLSVSPTTPWLGFNGGAGGGGYAAIARGATYLAIAGGGGGAGDAGNGGPGGGVTGQAGQASTLGPGGGGHAGTQSAGGVAGAGLYAALGIPGEPTEATATKYFPAGYLVGGGDGRPALGFTGVAGGGMGGGGFYGGGAGGTSAAGGGGGSGYIMPGLVGSMTAGSSYNSPGNPSDPDRGGKGEGAPPGNKTQYSKFYGIKGRDGRIVIDWS